MRTVRARVVSARWAEMGRPASTRRPPLPWSPVSPNWRLGWLPGAPPRATGGGRRGAEVPAGSKSPSAAASSHRGPASTGSMKYRQVARRGLRVTLGVGRSGRHRWPSASAEDKMGMRDEQRRPVTTTRQNVAGQSIRVWCMVIGWKPRHHCRTPGWPGPEGRRHRTVTERSMTSVDLFDRAVRDEHRGLLKDAVHRSSTQTDWRLAVHAAECRLRSSRPNENQVTIRLCSARSESDAPDRQRSQST
jgi:hypothetical protein